MEWFTTLINSISDFLNGQKLDIFKVGEYSPELYIALAGSVVVLLAFFIALVAMSASKQTKFRKSLEEAKAYVLKMQAIDKDNTDGLYERIKGMPVPVNKGWSNFMSQQTGYPSDFIDEKDCLNERNSGIKFKTGKAFFITISLIAVLICGLLNAVACLDLLDTASGITVTVMASVATVAIPLIVMLILWAILAGCNSKRFRKLQSAFRSFQDAIDEKVIIYREEQDEFVSENIEELNSAIEDIIANKLNNTEIVELVTTPAIEDDMLPAIEESIAPTEEEIAVAEAKAVEPEVVAEVAPAAAPAEVAAPVAAAVAEPMTEESKGKLLLSLVRIVEAAVSDPSSTKETINELAVLLYENMTGGNFNAPDEQEIFETCLQILANFSR